VTTLGARISLKHTSSKKLMKQLAIGQAAKIGMFEDNEKRGL
jgi:hypothetical protein